MNVLDKEKQKTSKYQFLAMAREVFMDLWILILPIEFGHCSLVSCRQSTYSIIFEVNEILL